MLHTYEFWFVVGSQFLYGPEVLETVAARAAEMIPPDATVFFDCGSTIYQLARLLILRKDLVAVTNSVHLAAMFASSGVRLITIGGEVRTASGAATGMLAVEAIHAITADLAFMGCIGFQNASGPCVENFPEAAVKKAADAVTCLIEQGADKAMAQFNG